MSGSSVRRLAAALLVGGLLLSFPATVGATVSGDCTAEGHASLSPAVDITTSPEWHLKAADIVGGSGTSTAPMTSATISAYALGIAIPVVNGSSKGDTSGSIDGVSLDTFSKLGKVFVIAGHATGQGTCDGQLLIILDDVDALFTVLGGGGLVIFILGLAAMVLTSRGGGCLSKLFGLVFGAIAATGLGLSLTQFQIISPTSPIGLVIVLVGAILGFLVAVRLGAPGVPALAAAAPPTVTPTSPTDAAQMTPKDMGHTAEEIIGADEPPPEEPMVGEAPVPPPPDPNAPGVDVGDSTASDG